GERALLIYPPGLDYVVAVCGCLYAGMVAVPAYPPDPSRLQRTLPRLQAIAADCRAAVALTIGPLLAMADIAFAQAPELRRLRWIATDEMANDHPEAIAAPLPIDIDAPAIVQYTSGSTGTPKGVVLTHANIVHNETMIRAAFEHDEDTVVVGWL